MKNGWKDTFFDRMALISSDSVKGWPDDADLDVAFTQSKSKQSDADEEQED